MYDASSPRRYPRRRRSRRPRLIATAAGIAASALLLIGGVAYGGGSSGPQRLTVHSGDTLWAIAQAHYGDDVQNRVVEIEQVNHLAGARISPGEVLVLPAP